MVEQASEQAKLGPRGGGAEFGSGGVPAPSGSAASALHHVERAPFLRYRQV
jgi:hypothetical protein